MAASTPGTRRGLAAMLDTEAALARALERAGLAPAGTGAAVTEAATAGTVDAADLGRQAALTGNPVPALVRALTRSVPADAAAAVHQGATSQDIIDTAAMLLDQAGVTEGQIDAALDPAGYLGAAGEFVDAAPGRAPRGRRHGGRLNRHDPLTR